MSDRSDELRRQRDLLREHLAWIEREIAAEAQRSGPAPLAEPLPQISPSPVEDTDAEAILSEYRRAGSSISTQTKRGCILYFALALAVFLVAILGFYLFTRAKLAR